MKRVSFPISRLGLWAPFLAVLVAFLAVWSGPAGAQFTPLSPGLGLLGGEEETAPEQSTPRPFTPRPSFDPESVPPPEAYGQLTDQAAPGPFMLSDLRRSVERFHARLVATMVEAPVALYELVTTLEAASPTGEPEYFLGVAVFALLLLAVGRATMRVVLIYVIRPWFVGLQRPDPRGFSEKLPVLFVRVLVTALGAAIAVGVASALGLAYYQGHQATLITTIVIFAIYAAGLIVDTIWRMALAPFLPAYRLVALDDAEARRLYRWITVVSVFAIVAIAFSFWIQALGLPRAVYVLFTIALSGVTVVGLLVLIRRNAGAIGRIVLMGVPRAEASWVALVVLRLWAPIGVVALLVSWGRLSYELVMGVETGPLNLVIPYLLLMGGLATYAVTAYGIERIFRRTRAVAAINARARAARTAEQDAALSAEMRGDGFGASGDQDNDGEDEGSAITAFAGRPAERRPGRSMQTFEDLAHRVASLFAIGAATYGLLYYWGGPGIFAENMVLGIAEDLIDICFVGYIAFHAVRIWMDQKIAEEVGDEDPNAGILDGEGGGTGATRLATLLPLVRNFILTIIAIAISLAVASEMGFNVAPLFAGAGIVGLAIGFGSQTLVRDILSGAFYLMDDAFRKGEYIDVGSVKGTVEKISLRSFQLRHHLGMLHTIPFGEIGHLTNFSRDWVMMKLPLRLTYDTDVEQVRKLVKKLGQQLLEDPTVGDKFLQPLKSQGVIEMEDSAMIVRVKFMTRPGDQWVVRKRVYQEIRELFNREGIKFAHREVTVRIPDLPQGPIAPEQQTAVGAAARTALDVIEGEQRRQTGTGGLVDDR